MSERRHYLKRRHFIRHGKAVAAAEDQPDIERMLGEVGKERAVARRDKMASWNIDFAVTSPAPRARGTAAIITGFRMSKIFVIDPLYPDPHDGGMGEALDSLFMLPHLGYAPVSAYLNEPGGDIVTDWGQSVWSLVQGEIELHGNPHDVAIFGHAVCLPALGMALCADNQKLVEYIAGLNLGECEGFTVILDEAEKPIGVEPIIV